MFPLPLPEGALLGAIIGELDDCDGGDDDDDGKLGVPLKIGGELSIIIGDRPISLWTLR